MKQDFSATREARFAALSTKTGLEQFTKLVRAHTKKVTVSKEAATASLRASGFVTPTGKLAKKYRND